MSKVERIIKQFPVLANYRDMVESVVKIREAFNLEGVPFELTVGDWKMGSLKKYFLELGARECNCENCKLNREKPTKKPKFYNRRFNKG